MKLDSISTRESSNPCCCLFQSQATPLPSMNFYPVFVLIPVTVLVTGFRYLVFISLLLWILASTCYWITFLFATYPDFVNVLRTSLRYLYTISY